MSEPVNPIPEEYDTVTPYFIVDGAVQAIEFYCKVFNAKEKGRMTGPNGTVGHAELIIGESIVMLADPCPDLEFKSPQAYGGTPVSCCVYVRDSDEVFERAIKAGAEVIRPIDDMFYGDRSGTIRDPFGHVWTISSRKEKLTQEEMERRAEEFLKQPESQSA